MVKVLKELNVIQYEGHLRNDDPAIPGEGLNIFLAEVELKISNYEKRYRTCTNKF